MLDGAWNSRAAYEMALEAKVDVRTVANWASDAARHIRLSRGNIEDIRERFFTELDKVKKLALEAKRTWVDKNGNEGSAETPDVKAYIAAQQRQAQLLGVDFDQAREQMTPIDPAELDRLIRARGYRKDDDATQPANQTGAERSDQGLR